MPKRKTTKAKPRRKVRRGRGIGSFFKNLWSKAKSGVSNLWNNNKAALQAKALSLANQAKDKALNYAREKRLLSSAVNKILPSRFGIDKAVSGYVNNQTGMGRRRVTRRRVGRPRKRMTGRGFFGDAFSAIKNIGGTVSRAVMPIVTSAATKMLTSKLGGGRRRKPARKPIRRTRRRVNGRGFLTGLISQMLPL